MAYRDAIEKLVRREHLTTEEAVSVMEELMEGRLTHAQMGAILATIAVKGETGAELAGFASVLRAKAVTVEVEGPLIDTCGTGGSGLATQNTSTMVAFVLAAAGARVAKHGNRASTGKCGSMDVLEALDVPIELGPGAVATLIREVGVGFMFAPKFHPAMRHVAPVRRELGVRSSFNFLGPLANPARTELQLLGVCDARRAELMIDALRQLGSKRVTIVRGRDGLDEVTLTGPTDAWILEDGEVKQAVIAPEDFGLAPMPPEAIAGGDPALNHRVFLDVLGGRCKDAVRDLVAVNSACALQVAGLAGDLVSAFERASAILDSGAALERFERYRARAKALS